MDAGVGLPVLTSCEFGGGYAKATRVCRDLRDLCGMPGPMTRHGNAPPSYPTGYTATTGIDLMAV